MSPLRGADLRIAVVGTSAGTLPPWWVCATYDDLHACPRRPRSDSAPRRSVCIRRRYAPCAPRGRVAAPHKVFVADTHVLSSDVCYVRQWRGVDHPALRELITIRYLLRCGAVGSTRAFIRLAMSSAYFFGSGSGKVWCASTDWKATGRWAPAGRRLCWVWMLVIPPLRRISCTKWSRDRGDDCQALRTWPHSTMGSLLIALLTGMRSIG